MSDKLHYSLKFSVPDVSLGLAYLPVWTWRSTTRSHSRSTRSSALWMHAT